MKVKGLNILLVFMLCSLSLFADIKPRPIQDGKQGMAAREKAEAEGDVNCVKLDAQLAAARKVASLKASTQPMKVGLHSSAPLSSFGSPKIPVILVQFPDLKFSVASTNDSVNIFYDLFCNGTRDGNLYKGAGSYGSVRDYFINQSDSIFQPEFVVIGPVTLSQSYAYYGEDSGTSKDINITEFYKEAIKAAQLLISSWTEFDNDLNGTVDMVKFIYAGEGENGCSDTGTIWPKESGNWTMINNIKYGAYACTNELYKNVSDGIGVFCHELSHALGLPDLYDTAKNPTNYGLDYWDLMDSGCYCKNGYQPCCYSAYEKDFMGWKSLNTIPSGSIKNLSLTPISEGGDGYKITNPENANEYYVLENRQNTGWDEFIGRGRTTFKHHGMLLSHIDYVQSVWTSNKVNYTSNSHQYYTIIPADSTLYSYTEVNSNAEYTAWMYSAFGDLYPGYNNITSLSKTRELVYTTSGSMNRPLASIKKNEDRSVSLAVSVLEDVNLDGNVDSQDVLYVYEMMSSGVSGSSIYKDADVNNDSTVDSQDVLLIYEYMKNH